MNYIKDEIDTLVKKYKTRDPYELCSALNIVLKKVELHHEINGIYQYEKKNQFIYINQSLPEELQRVICSHELGHARLHKRVNSIFIKNHTIYNKNKIERAANLFAAHLIIPDEMLSFNGQTINEIANELNVPVELLQLKLEGSNFFKRLM